MRHVSGISASFAAIVSSVASIGCCLPLGFAAALGAAGTSAFFERLRPWLLGASVLLLGVGFWQQRHARQCSAKRSRASAALLWVAVVVVVGMILFPQAIAGFIADGPFGAWKQ